MKLKKKVSNKIPLLLYFMDKLWPYTVAVIVQSEMKPERERRMASEGDKFRKQTIARH